MLAAACSALAHSAASLVELERRSREDLAPAPRARRPTKAEKKAEKRARRAAP
jgi:hypothetical protein